MPELPEVEHVRRNLDRWTRGARIVQVSTADARIVRPETPGAFITGVTGRTVVRIARRGKWLRIELDDSRLVFAHLGMTGWFEHGLPEEAPLRFERVRFELARRGKRARLTYVDPRRWGRLVLSPADIPAWTALGPDPLTDGVDPSALQVKLARRKRSSIKEALMDQTVLAGIGNIQAIEALWKAGIDPRSPAAALDPSDVVAIAGGLRWTIERTLLDLAKNGMGAAASPFRVYGRKGAPCPRCAARLERIILGGRTTIFCPTCQRRRRGARARPA